MIPEVIVAISGVLGMCIMFYVFRKPMRTLTGEAPEAISNILSTIIKSTKQFDTIVTTNCIENQVDCQVRVKAALTRMRQEDLPIIDQAYNEIMGIK